MREENLEMVLSDVCAKCKKAGRFFEEWFLDFLYKSGKCEHCGYDNHVLIKKA